LGGPSLPFGEAFRRELTARCQTFPRRAAAAQGLKPAAVALAVVDAEDGSGEAALLLTRRTAGLRAHAGQWALPGGRCDAGETVETAARRELHEELGLSLPAEEVLGVLDDYVTRSGYVVTPVVAWLADTRAMAPNPAEVHSVHRVRLGDLGAPGAVELLTIPESPRPVIRLNIGDSHIHAPTAALMHQLSELAAGRVTRVAELEAPVFAWR
jgi:8-oxo-dGTP pyrophosphatase MutT (NUDIX family)